MKILRWMLLGFPLLGVCSSPPPAQAECRIVGSTPTYTAGQLKDLTCDTSGLIQTEIVSGAVTLSGSSNIVTLGTLISGEDQGTDDADVTGTLLRTGPGRTRWRTSASAITTNTTSAAFQLPTGSKTLFGQVDGTGAVTATLAIYGGFENAASTTDKLLLCTITLSGTTTFVDACPPITANFLYYVAVSTNVTGTGATAKLLAGF